MICHSCSIAMVSCLFHPFPSGWYGTRVQELVGASDTSTLSPRTASRLRSSWMARRYGRKRCWIVYRPENQATKLYSYFLDKRSTLQPTTTSLAPLTCSLGPIKCDSHAYAMAKHLLDLSIERRQLDLLPSDIIATWKIFNFIFLVFRCVAERFAFHAHPESQKLIR